MRPFAAIMALFCVVAVCAQEAFRRAIAQKPDDFEAHLRLGSV